MNKLTVFVVCCLFLQLTSGAPFPFSRRETTRAAWDDLIQKLGKTDPAGKATTMSEQLTVPTIIRYSTTQIENLAQDEDTWFMGELCGHSVGKAVNITMLLNNNPGWEPTKGVVNFEVVDSNYQDGVLCTNKDADGYATSSCLIESWPNKFDIIILAKAGPVSGIALSLNAEFYEQGSPAALHIKANIPSLPGPKTLSLPGFNPQSLPALPIPLTESVSVFPSFSLGYLQEAMIQFSWCSNAETHVFSVESTVTSADGESSYAQYVCDKLPCDVGMNNIAHNGEQLTSNTVLTDPMQYKDIYVVVVNWGGAYDADADTYVGDFLYNANQVKLL